jgi:adenosylcobinamide-phosphate synthase
MPRSGLALGLLLGTALDALVGDPARGHPVAVFGAAAAHAERRFWADSRLRGAAFVLLSVGPVLAAGAVAQRCARAGRGPAAAGAGAAIPAGPAVAGPAVASAAVLAGPAAVAGPAVLAAAATWTVLGGKSLAAEAAGIARLLEAGDVAAARRRLPALCGRDPDSLDAAGIARAVVESVAENTSDAVVAPLFWGAAGGVGGLLGYRAVNTLDAMIGHRSARYRRFGWAAARLDDLANLAPARLTAMLALALAPAVGGSPRAALRVLRRDGADHPSPNAGRCEAAFAGALGVRLGGTNVYAGHTEQRGLLGDGPPPGPHDIGRAIRLSRLITAATAILAALAATLAGREPRS